MKRSLKENITVFIIPLTTFPFLLLLGELDFALFNTNQTLFWSLLASTAASVLGLVGAVLMIWQFLLGIRYIARLITEDVLWVNNTHKWLGKYGTVLIFLHPALELYTYSEYLFWTIVPNISSDFEKYVTFGRFAYISLILIWVSSVFLRKKIAFRPWKYIHYLSYPALALVLLHSLEIGTNLNRFSVLRTVWAAFLPMLIILTIYKFLKLAAIRKHQYTLTNKYSVGEDVLIFTLKPTGKYLKPSGGQHCYIQTSRFGESHPFSVIEYIEKDNSLVFGVKAVGKHTKKIHALKEGATVFLDGPYGVFTEEGRNADPKVIIAGGIGVTPFIDLVKKYNDNTYFFNCNRYLKQAVYRDQLMSILTDRYVDCLSKESEIGSCIINERISGNIIKSKVGENNLQNYNYFICGSPKFNKALKETLLELDIKPNRIFIEDFGL